MNFKNYRKSFTVTRIFNAWKEYQIKEKVAKLLLKKRYMRAWNHFIITRNYILPQGYRERRLKAVFMARVMLDIKEKWNL